MSQRTRKLALALHVVFSVGWIGISASMVVLALVGLNTTHPGVRVGSYNALMTLDETIMGIFALVSLITGVWLGLGTPFGLIRYWWVVAKQVLFGLVMIGAFGFTHIWVIGGLDEALATGGITSGGVALVFGAPTLMALLTAAAVISVYKPWGRTPRGKRPAGTTVVVKDIRLVAEDIVSVALADPKGASLDAWTPGAHVDLILPSGKVRQYSIHSDPADRSAYRCAVLLERDGRGGSREIHGLKPGKRIAIRGPRNNFPLVDAPSYLFVAGGIGVTPLMPMIRSVDDRRIPWRLVYVGRSLRSMAFAMELRNRYPGRVALHPRDTTNRPDLAAILRWAPSDCHVYSCGPERLLEALTRIVPSQRLHIEHFVASTALSDLPKQPFDVVLASTSTKLTIPSEQTLLAALREYAPGIEASCEDGVCGTCKVAVLSGVPEHRDNVLQPAERDRDDVIYPCVSRAKSARLVLDL
nr:PDR/VanB family oxidoreductase [Kibdelosporangium sp. MJ126-NF4]